MPAPLGQAGRIADHGNMGAQIAQSYAKIEKVLASCGATMDDILEEGVCVSGMDRAFGRGEVRKQAYSGRRWSPAPSW